MIRIKEKEIKKRIGNEEKVVANTKKGKIKIAAFENNNNNKNTLTGCKVTTSHFDHICNAYMCFSSKRISD